MYINRCIQFLNLMKDNKFCRNVNQNEINLITTKISIILLGIIHFISLALKLKNIKI